MNRILYCDTETYCETPITDGTYRYAEGAQIMLFAYAFDDGPIQVWDCTADHTMPKDLFYGLKDKDTRQIWHNSMFDRTVLRYARGMDVPPERIHDTMVIALMHGLPGGLGKLCEIFNIDADEAKDKRGRQLIQLFCKPQPKNRKVKRATSATHPEDWEDFIAYARNDIAAMRAIYPKMPKWNLTETEYNLWCLDQRINDRGFTVDTDMAERAMDAIAVEQKRLKKAVQKKTGGEVESATKRDQLLAYILKEHGVTLPDMQKATLERRMNDPELPQAVKDLIAIRLDASITSTSKYKKLVRGVNKDGRLRGTLQFSGAQRTSRWAGRTFQPQNLPRPSHKQHVIDNAIDILKLDGFDLVFGDIMKLTSSMIRGAIIASEDKKLVVSDLSNIEGRVATWLAGEEWKIQAFADFDDGEGHDIYKLTYGRSFSVDPSTVTKDQRQIGKVQELALGYQGGVGAFVTMVATYGMDIEEMAERARPSIPDDIMSKAQKTWEWAVDNGRTCGLPEDIFVVCDGIKRLWRGAHPEINSYWHELEDIVRAAINNPGTAFDCRRLRIACKSNWLRIKLPSGRCLSYPAPRVKDYDPGEESVNEFRGISYMGMNQYTRKWSRIYTYGGKLFENICQAVARDVMAANMPIIDKAGYEILLTVHDELITEAQDNEEFNADGLSALLSTPPEWAEGLPLAAGGYAEYRYRKD